MYSRPSIFIPNVYKERFNQSSYGKNIRNGESRTQRRQTHACCSTDRSARSPVAHCRSTTALAVSHQFIARPVQFGTAGKSRGDVSVKLIRKSQERATTYNEVKVQEGEMVVI